MTKGNEVVDTNGYPASGGSGCTPAASFTACVTDGALQSELTSRLNALGLPIDDSHIYMAFFPSGVETCEGPNTISTVKCSASDYCAYHSDTSSAPYLIYANLPFPDLKYCVDTTNGAQAPNGDAYADTEISLISHEASEAITDWAGAWMDRNGFENGDQCNFIFGVPQGTAGAYYNQVIGTDKFYTQDEFSNEDWAMGKGDPITTGATVVPGCVKNEELPIASFTPPSPTTGVSSSFDASASSDPDNTQAPLRYSWSWGDGTPGGSGVSSSHLYCSPGTYNVGLAVTDSSGWSSSVMQQVSVAEGVPIINVVAPGVGRETGGTNVTIKGCAFTGVTGVKFGGTDASSVQLVSDQQITAVTPAHSLGTVDITMTSSSGTSAVSTADRFTFVFNGLYTLDAYGGIHPADSSGVSVSGYWAGWQIAKTAKPWPGKGTPQAGMVLDGFGGLHPFGSPTLQVGQEPYYLNHDVARDFVFLPDGTGGYELDGYGGIHPFSIGSNAMPAAAGQYPYFPGQDLAKKITLLPDASGGYVLDAYGGLHPWSVSGHVLPSPVAEYGYWAGQNIARDMWLAAGSTAASGSGYVLDAYGGFHPFWTAAATPPPSMGEYGYWAGRDIARGFWFMPGATPGTASGYTVDAYGGIHPFAAPGQVLPATPAQYGYWGGQDLARAIWGA